MKFLVLFKSLFQDSFSGGNFQFRVGVIVAVYRSERKQTTSETYLSRRCCDGREKERERERELAPTIYRIYGSKLMTAQGHSSADGQQQRRR
jgi:hypothetical protein